MVSVLPADRLDLLLKRGSRAIGTKPQVKLSLRLSGHHVGGACTGLNVGDLESGRREILISIVPVGRGELADDAAEPVNGVVCEVRVGNMSLDAPDGECPSEGAPPAVLDDITEALGARRLTLEAPLDCFVSFNQGLNYANCTIDGRPFFITCQ